MWRYAVVFLGLTMLPAEAHHAHHPHSKAISIPPRAAKTLARIDPHSLIGPVRHEPGRQRAQTLCLALGMYHEARGLSTREQMAVGHVVMNRGHHTHQTVCQTLWQPYQFPWTKRSPARLKPHEPKAWAKVQHSAVKLIAHRGADITHGATLFYNPRLSHPGWARRAVRTLRLSHVFLRPRRS